VRQIAPFYPHDVVTKLPRFAGPGTTLAPGLDKNRNGQRLLEPGAPITVSVRDHRRPHICVQGSSWQLLSIDLQKQQVEVMPVNVPPARDGRVGALLEDEKKYEVAKGKTVAIPTDTPMGFPPMPTLFLGSDFPGSRNCCEQTMLLARAVALGFAPDLIAMAPPHVKQLLEAYLLTQPIEELTWGYIENRGTHMLWTWMPYRPVQSCVPRCARANDGKLEVGTAVQRDLVSGAGEKWKVTSLGFMPQDELVLQQCLATQGIAVEEEVLHDADGYHLEDLEDVGVNNGTDNGDDKDNVVANDDDDDADAMGPERHDAHDAHDAVPKASFTSVLSALPPGVHRCRDHQHNESRPAQRLRPLTGLVRPASDLQPHGLSSRLTLEGAPEILDILSWRVGAQPGLLHVDKALHSATWFTEQPKVVGQRLMTLSLEITTLASALWREVGDSAAPTLLHFPWESLTQASTRQAQARGLLREAHLATSPLQQQELYQTLSVQQLANPVALTVCHRSATPPSTELRHFFVEVAKQLQRPSVVPFCLPDQVLRQDPHNEFRYWTRGALINAHDLYTEPTWLPLFGSFGAIVLRPTWEESWPYVHAKDPTLVVQIPQTLLPNEKVIHREWWLSNATLHQVSVSEFEACSSVTERVALLSQRPSWRLDGPTGLLHYEKLPRQMDTEAEENLVKPLYVAVELNPYAPRNLVLGPFQVKDCWPCTAHLLPEDTKAAWKKHVSYLPVAAKAVAESCPERVLDDLPRLLGLEDDDDGATDSVVSMTVSLQIPGCTGCTTCERFQKQITGAALPILKHRDEIEQLLRRRLSGVRSTDLGQSSWDMEDVVQVKAYLPSATLESTCVLPPLLSLQHDDKPGHEKPWLRLTAPDQVRPVPMNEMLSRLSSFALALVHVAREVEVIAKLFLEYENSSLTKRRRVTPSF
jgi:hypothetical protein